MSNFFLYFHNQNFPDVTVTAFEIKINLKISIWNFIEKKKKNSEKDIIDVVQCEN